MAETRSQPLPDDVSAEDLAARPKQPKVARKASTTAAYAATAGKWWPAFLKAAGWDGTVKGVFIEEDGTPQDGTFRQLFIWLYEQDVTKGVYKPCPAPDAPAPSALQSAASLSPGLRLTRLCFRLLCFQ